MQNLTSFIILKMPGIHTVKIPKIVCKRKNLPAHKPSSQGICPAFISIYNQCVRSDCIDECAEILRLKFTALYSPPLPQICEQAFPASTLLNLDLMNSFRPPSFFFIIEF